MFEDEVEGHDSAPARSPGLRRFVAALNLDRASLCAVIADHSNCMDGGALCAMSIVITCIVIVTMHRMSTIL